MHFVLGEGNVDGLWKAEKRYCRTCDGRMNIFVKALCSSLWGV